MYETTVTQEKPKAPRSPITPNTKDIINLFTSDISTIGFNSGVPTRTTATLTPTMLRNVEQCLELQCQVEPHLNQAGFAPPVVPSNQGILMSLVDTKRWQGGSTRISEGRSIASNTCTLTVSNNKCSTPQTKRNPGGRKPNKDIDISPEEEERRAVRRERNKMAAARCRKRRLDHTNELIEETEELEGKKQSLQNEIQQLKMKKDELEYILESHKPCCRLNSAAPPPTTLDPVRADSPPDIKPFIGENGQVVCAVPQVRITACKKTVVPVAKQGLISTSSPSLNKRPDSLPVPVPVPVSVPVFPTTTTADGVPITTPTNGIPFNFDSLMEGGTGLTPVSAPLIPSCSSQQRNSDLSSPDSNKLVSL